MRGWWMGDRGQSLVEISLLLPVLIFGLLGGTDLARAYTAQVAIQNAAAAGAEARAMDVTTTEAGVTTYVQNELSGTAGVTASAAIVTLTESTVDSVQYYTVRVRYTWSTLVAWPLVPNTVQFDRSVTMRKVA